MSQQERHEALVRAINRINGRETFSIKKKEFSPYDSDDNAEKMAEIISLGALIADVMNYTGGSVGQVDLYKLLGTYLTDDDKRHQINQIIKH